jgi:hypothetical protein
LASIAASELVAVEGVSADKIIMVSFGQPRIGNREFAEEYAKRVILLSS